jgi:hypothetical protein
MTRSRFQKRLFARATAWLLILICGWMGTDGVLHHTDEGASPSAAASLHRATAATPAHSCAACEWTQGMQAGALLVCRVPSPLFALDLCAAPPVRPLLGRVARRSSPRAPPVFPTPC